EKARLVVGRVPWDAIDPSYSIINRHEDDFTWSPRRNRVTLRRPVIVGISVVEVRSRLLPTKHDASFVRRYLPASANDDPQNGFAAGDFFNFFRECAFELELE